MYLSLLSTVLKSVKASSQNLPHVLCFRLKQHTCLLTQQSYPTADQSTGTTEVQLGEGLLIGVEMTQTAALPNAIPAWVTLTKIGTWSPQHSLQQYIRLERAPY